jgi:hypothetical protein
MTRTFLYTSAIACALAVAIACGNQSPAPVSPSSVDLAEITDANPDGSTLKATAPTPQSPVNGQKPDGIQVALVVSGAEMKHAAGIPLSYRFEIQNMAGTKVYDSGVVSGTTHVVGSAAQLTPDDQYQWRARSEYQGLPGPWSSLARFVAPATRGYIQGNELYDPLVNGQTMGTLHGPVTFIPGKGIKLESQMGYVSYQLPQTLTEGEFSILVTNLRTNTEGGKTKLFAMSEGYSDIVTNDRRMTVEKRGDPPGIVAWRFITHGDEIDTEGAEREARSFDPNQDYLWEASWRNNFFKVRIIQGGANGNVIYDKGKHFSGRAYDPDPHVLFLGAPIGRSGPDGASVDGVIIRQVWVSSRPRPGFAN